MAASKFRFPLFRFPLIFLGVVCESGMHIQKGENYQTNNVEKYSATESGKDFFARYELKNRYLPVLLTSLKETIVQHIAYCLVYFPHQTLVDCNNGSVVSLQPVYFHFHIGYLGMYSSR